MSKQRTTKVRRLKIAQANFDFFVMNKPTVTVYIDNVKYTQTTKIDEKGNKTIRLTRPKIDICPDYTNDKRVTELGYTPLIIAVVNDGIDGIKIMFDRGYVTDTNINETDADGWTALMTAVQCNYVDCVKYLLSRGADPFCRSTYECSIYDNDSEHILYPLI